MFTPEQTQIANSTSRNSSAIGGKAITPKHVLTIARNDQTILDFGAGKDAAHAIKLCSVGLDVTAYEFGNNHNPLLHDLHALMNTYDIVYASNVLNVQQSEEMMRNTIQQIADATGTWGKAVMNYPNDPRKSTITVTELIMILHEHFTVVRFVGGTRSAPLFECWKNDK